MSEIIYDIIRAPIITEKSTLLSEFSKVTFKVSKDATKPAIKRAVEKLFSVKVVAVNTLNGEGKIKRFRGKVGKRSDYKKAIVTLEAGQEIDISGGIK